MIAFPNAKINLGLQVTERRPDGYHNLETLFYPVPLADILEVVPGNSFQFKATGLELDAEPGKNLAVRAYDLLRKEFDLPPVRIHLHKVIPFGAGLGGGSADAAFMLNMVNELFSLRLTTDRLKSFAARIGADCPFFIENRPAFASGTGHILSPANIDLSAYHLVIAKPPYGVSTAEAYRSITPRKPETPLTEILSRPADEWKEFLSNDFEDPVFRLYPGIRDLKEQFYRSGAVYASMSGSGSAVFGLFRERIPDLTEFSGEGLFVYQNRLGIL